MSFTVIERGSFSASFLLSLLVVEKKSGRLAG